MRHEVAAQVLDTDMAGSLVPLVSRARNSLDISSQ